jgi:Reverse transcriptase (RNA-dependent DNA polymerase)
MEVLINNVRNEVTSFQAFFIKEKNREFSDALSELRNLKKQYKTNAEKIRVLENSLNEIADTEIRLALENFDWFEHVSAEKMSPKFLDLAKSEKQEANLSDIKNDAGEEFVNENERNNYIRNYFKEIYAKKQGVNPYRGCVEEFLGPDICNHPKVHNAKLRPDQKNLLDSPLTIQELDGALVKMCVKSDGLSVKFIKKYWNVFRTPLLYYAHECADKGTLTHSFSTASIRLIPKKGSPSNLKNWRPISLLNVLYKVISKAINQRLQKVAGTIISRSQKRLHR